MSSDAGGRPEVKGMTGHPPAVCSRVWPRQREKNDDRQLTDGMVERAAADASKKNGHQLSFSRSEGRHAAVQVLH